MGLDPFCLLHAMYIPAPKRLCSATVPLYVLLPLGLGGVQAVWSITGLFAALRVFQP